MLQVMKIFHDKGVKHVVLTSLALPDYEDLIMLASEKGTYYYYSYHNNNNNMAPIFVGNTMT